MLVKNNKFPREQKFKCDFVYKVRKHTKTKGVRNN
uniref:Uncharacterized protein n=1 Tax=Arundo donax TaxID=35708 RepID=A0A0A9FHU2_ARUDO